MDIFDWFVPPGVLGDPRKRTRHKGIAKSLLVISLVTSLMLLGDLLVRDNLHPAEYALFAAAICTPTLGALLIRATGDITLGLVTTNIGGILIVVVWAFLTGGIISFAIPVFLANLALLSTFGNVAILLVMGTILMAALVFLYLATTMGWLPASFLPDSSIPALMLISSLGSVWLIVLAGVMVARERVNAKSHLRAAQLAAEQSSRAKTVFLTSMGHELRTPLNSILGFGQLLLLNEPKTLNKEQSRAIENIITAGQYLLALVTQILEMSRIEANELQVNMEPVPAEEIILPCLSIIELEAQAKRISVVHDCGVHAKWAVWADRVLVQQVLLNLISNAVNFNRNAGTIIVTCQQSGADFLRICVADTGVGIAISRRDELFEPFARLGAEAGTIKGAGLGLATSKRLIERMRGHIGYESTEGVGSVFWIELPLAEEHPEAGLSAAAAGAPQHAVSPLQPEEV